MPHPSLLVVDPAPDTLAAAHEATGGRAEVRHAPSRQLLERIGDEWAGSGPVGVVAFDPRLLPWSRDPGPALSSVTTGIWEQTLVRIPHELVTWEQSVWVGRLRPDGTVEPLD